jgi:glycine cleavage system aminomethyltransferase T
MAGGGIARADGFAEFAAFLVDFLENGFRIGKSLALAMVKPEVSEVGTELQMDILGTSHRVTVIEESPFDAENERLRA